MEKVWEKESQKKVVDPNSLEEWVKEIRRQKKTIATLNGTFDLLHAGHLHMIYEAKKQADILIIALNSDSSIRRNKGKKRPIIPLPFRLQMIAALKFVDFVTYFEEEDPRQILSCIRPDVHVNGEEYGENCIEAPIVHSFKGRLHIVKKIVGLSTSEIIKKIKS